MTQNIDFSAALLNPDLAVPETLITPEKKPALKRFQVYRNNVISGLIDAVQAGFPAVYALVGEDFFRAMVGVYVRKHSPLSPVLTFYGHDFADFILGFDPAKSVPYLADIARLEYLRREAYHAEDATALTNKDFAALGDEIVNCRTHFHPALRILPSRWPVLDIYLKAQGRIDKLNTKTAQNIVITRPDFNVMINVAPRGFLEFINALETMTIALAAEHIVEKITDAPIVEYLPFMAQHGIVKAISKG